MKKVVRMSQAGFSLVELMVVVAIIGILATIAIPQVSKFQAKARQTEAKTMLSNIYTAEKGFFVEWSGYHLDLQVLGVGVEGTNYRYNAGFGGTTTCTAGFPSGSATLTSGQQNLGGLPGIGSFYGGTAPTVTNGSCNNTIGGQTFTAYANGYPGSQTTTADVWNMNQSKQLTNTVPTL